MSGVVLVGIRAGLGGICGHLARSPDQPQDLRRSPDTVVLEMGLPLWVPSAGVHLATYGAARANAQAAAEVLGLVR
jgi:hypothetical protein